MEARLPRLGTRRSGCRSVWSCSFAVILIAAVFTGPSPVAGTPDVRHPQACEASQPAGVPPSRVAAMARGFNLTGWLDSASPRPPDRALLAELRGRGFTHIRLPVTAERLMEAFSSSDSAARQYLELDRAIHMLLGLGFSVSLDLHPGEALGRLHVDDPETGLRLIENVWRVLVRRYSQVSDDRLFFELLNEPKVPWSVWTSQGPRLVEAIRREAPGRTLIFGHANFQRVDALAELAPLADRNVVYAAHFYDPMIFTHQGLDWSDDPLRYLQGVPFPTRAADPAIVRLLGTLAVQGRPAAAALVNTQLSEPWTEERIEGEIAAAAVWAQRHRRPVIINEFGVLSWKAPPLDRARWLRAVRSAAERHCIGWTHWDYADSFGFVRRIGDREVPDPMILDALMGGAITPVRLR